MSLHTDIKGQVKEAMIAKDTVRLSVVRGLLAAFVNEAVAKRMPPDAELSDEMAMSVIERQAKQRKDSIEQFEKGGRADLAEDEKAELAVLETYLPTQMTEDEITAFVKAKQQELSLNPATAEMATKEKSGQFTGLIMKDLKGKADGMVVKKAVDSLFA